jgi:hypothetical protein
MIIPDRDPREVLVARNEVKIGPVCGEAFPVVIKATYHILAYCRVWRTAILYSREDLTVWQGDPAVGVSPAIFAVGVLVDVIA